MLQHTQRSHANSVESNLSRSRIKHSWPSRTSSAAAHAAAGLPALGCLPHPLPPLVATRASDGHAAPSRCRCERPPSSEPQGERPVLPPPDELEALLQLPGLLITPHTSSQKLLLPLLRLLWLFLLMLATAAAAAWPRRTSSLATAAAARLRLVSRPPAPRASDGQAVPSGCAGMPPSDDHGAERTRLGGVL